MILIYSFLSIFLLFSLVMKIIIYMQIFNIFVKFILFEFLFLCFLKFYLVFCSMGLNLGFCSCLEVLGEGLPVLSVCFVACEEFSMLLGTPSAYIVLFLHYYLFFNNRWGIFFKRFYKGISYKFKRQ